MDTRAVSGMDWNFERRGGFCRLVLSVLGDLVCYVLLWGCVFDAE